MPEWFVYCDLTYYPWASIIEADTPEEAARKEVGSNLGDGVVVLPADAIAYSTANVLPRLRDRAERGE